MWEGRDSNKREEKKQISSFPSIEGEIFPGSVSETDKTYKIRTERVLRTPQIATAEWSNQPLKNTSSD